MKTKHVLPILFLLSITQLANAQWQVNNPDIYYNRGNVGIGTNTPNARLHIHRGFARILNAPNDSLINFQTGQEGFSWFSQQVVPYGLGQNPSGRRTSFQVNVTGVAPGILNFPARPSVTQYAFASDYLLFRKEYLNNGMADYARIGFGINSFFNVNGGNVGIGTDAPTAKLHIVSNKDNNGETASVEIVAGTQRMLIDGNEIDGVTNGLHLNHNTDEPVLLANGGGKVGIGTPGPTSKLTVNGSDNNGTTATVEVRSANERLLIDGNEIDGISEGLHLNNNTEQVVTIANGGGKVGIGTASPSGKVEIRYNSSYNNPTLELTQEGDDESRIYFRNTVNNARRFAIGANPGNADPRFSIGYNNGNGTTNILTIDGDNHRVGIMTGGTIPEGYRLAVNGKMLAEEVRVQLSQFWPDYVFAEDYPLLPLEEVENYIRNEGRLPGIPTAAEVAADGLALGDMQRLMMEKIEELTLHLIDLKKENDSLRQRLDALEQK